MQLIEYKISEIGTVLTGKTPPGSNEESFGGNVYFLTPSDMDGTRKPLKIARTLSELGQSQLHRLIVPKGVAVSCIGSQMGKSCLLKSPFATNQQINTILPDDSIADLDYLYYLLSSMRDYLFRLGVGAGSTMPILNKGSFENISVFLPDLENQKKISSILSKLDDKIELNNQTNETLESIAKAIFKEWFIDFGPVKAKAEGKKPFGMDDETAALFPDSFEESELGLIPKGWRAGSLRDIANVTGGYAFKSFDFSESGHPVVKIKNISESLDVDLIDVDYVPTEVAEKVTKFHLKDGSLVMAMTGATVGKFGVVVHTSGLVPVLNQRVALFESKDQGITFLLSTLLITNAYEQIVNRAEGSAQPNISADGIMDTKIIVPSKELRKSFCTIFNPLFELWMNNKKESISLKELRDLLLPKLISGEIDISEK